MKYRSRTEIIATILESVRSGSTKTKIMYKAYLSYSQMKEYLQFIQENNLMEYESGAQIYRITDKGIQFLTVYEDIVCLVSPSDPLKQKSFVI